MIVELIVMKRNTELIVMNHCIKIVLTYILGFCQSLTNYKYFLCDCPIFSEIFFFVFDKRRVNHVEDFSGLVELELQPYKA